MKILLYLAAALIVLLGFAHSYLGERYILVRLFRRGELPKVLGSAEFTAQTLRFAWHITSIAWFGLAAVVVALAHPPVSAGSIGWIIGLTFFAHGLVALVASRGRHLSWPVFLAIGALLFHAAAALL